nr:MAG TPA: hypothetical protein [Bacteriophage sp.]
MLNHFAYLTMFLCGNYSTRYFAAIKILLHGCA